MLRERSKKCNVCKRGRKEGRFDTALWTLYPTIPSLITVTPNQNYTIRVPHPTFVVIHTSRVTPGQRYMSIFRYLLT